MATRVFIKTVLVDKLSSEIMELIPDKFDGLSYNQDDSEVIVHLSSEPTLQEDTDLTALINNHVPTPTVHSSIMSYLRGGVSSFVDEVLDYEAATNMELGITQAGKTAEVLGLIVKQYDYKSNGKPVSLYESMRLKSLYETIEIIDYIRSNPSEFTGLDPYINDARLLSLKNKVEGFLNIPLTT